MGAIHIHLHSSQTKVRDRKVKVKDANKFVTKKAIRLPNDPALGNRAGGVMEQGTVVYKEGSGYRPWFHKGNVRLNIPTSELVAETTDNKVKDILTSEEKSRLEKEYERLGFKYNAMITGKTPLREQVAVSNRMKEIRAKLGTKDADPISMSKSKVLEKCKSGEWEAMQDIVANRTLQFRKNGKTFFVKVTDNKFKD